MFSELTLLVSWRWGCQLYPGTKFLENDSSEFFLDLIEKCCDFFWKFLKSENFEKVGFQLKIFENRKFSKSWFSKIFNWNPTFLKFSDFNDFLKNFKLFWDRPQKISAESIFKILVSVKSWESPLQKIFTVNLVNI